MPPHVLPVGEKVPWGGLFSAQRLPHCKLPTCEGESALTPDPCSALSELEDGGGGQGEALLSYFHLCR